MSRGRHARQAAAAQGPCTGVGALACGAALLGQTPTTPASPLNIILTPNEESPPPPSPDYRMKKVQVR